MWLVRGAQSAVFYYVTCTPCDEALNRRKIRNDAVRSRQREKQHSEAVVTDQPRPFPQPMPFSTNPGWMEELALGPGPPKRRGGRATAHHRVESWDTGALSTGSFQDLDISPTPSQRMSKLGPKQLGDRFNRMLRYQREDEPLWGEEVEVKGSSVGMPGQGKVDARAPSKYYIPRVPPVNDLHPPIVSGPKSRAETRWMLQPPPSARVMSGKEKSPMTARPGAVRMESDRSTSRRSVRTHVLPPLSTVIMESSPMPSPAVDFRSPLTPSTPDSSQDLARPPSPAYSAYGKDEAHFVISSSVYSRSDSCSTLSSVDSDMDSPADSLHSPNTPISRPVSKGFGNFEPRPAISRALTTVHQDKHKRVQMLQFELDETHDLQLGQVEKIRPFRWSMDF
ncbi:hypothetical protein BJY04DRAFT_177700 [Aspergillus karnatakaensis]|uniref:uncharacterized protein n=1 Tax=Aspergillus karnatakaensis TaxID=1810916 RepID=UPI003CCDD746